MRPDPSEYYTYYDTYVRLVPEDDLIGAMIAETESTKSFLRGVSEVDETGVHAPYRWSVRQVVGHVIDAERVFSYRGLRISRNDSTPIPGFDEGPYVAESCYATIGLSRLIDELWHLRRANLIMLENLSPEQWSRSGTASGWTVTVRALAYMMLGHERHHMSILRKRLSS